MNPVPPSTINCNKTSQTWQQIFVDRFWPSGTHVQNPARLHVGKTQMALRSPHPVQDLGYLGWGSLQWRKIGMIGIKCGKTSHIFQEKLRLSIMFSLASSLPYFAHAHCHTVSASSTNAVFKLCMFNGRPLQTVHSTKKSSKWALIFQLNIATYLHLRYIVYRPIHCSKLTKVKAGKSSAGTQRGNNMKQYSIRIS